jgi:hypothetical protein
MVMETATDQKGRFYFPAWGPKTVPPEMPHPMKSPPHLVNRDPQMLLFKSGYKWTGRENTPMANYNKDSLRKSEWNGKTIKMEKFKGDLKEYAAHLEFFHPHFIREDCNWKSVPKMVLALDKQREIFIRNSIDTGLLSINSLEGMSPADKKRCGSAVEFFTGRQR